MTALMIALGAFVGAPGRYLVDRAVQSRHSSAFPFGTFTVNVAASFILGLVTGLSGHLNAHVATLIGAGFCGALSTYSTFGFEMLRLTREATRTMAIGYVAASMASGIAAAALGWLLGSALV
ncbi:MAG: fluoride efflux transporter FluC [Jatrophihabitans sp.]